MKITIFATNNLEDVEAFSGRAAKGNRAVRVIDPEEELVTEIDEQRMHPGKVIASRFLKFLKDKNLTLAILDVLSSEETLKLAREFWENN